MKHLILVVLVGMTACADAASPISAAQSRSAARKRDTVAVPDTVTLPPCVLVIDTVVVGTDTTFNPRCTNPQ